METTYNISALDDINESVNFLTKRIFNAIYWVVNGVKAIAGYLGLIVLIIPSIFLMPIIMLYLMRANSILQKSIQSMYNWINEAESSELRYAHLKVERLNNATKIIKRKGKIIDRNIFSMGISSQFNILFKQLETLEETLHNAAYPEYDKELTDQDIEELKMVFAGAEMD